ncbi:MAG: Lsr2 family protein [Mycobacterium sp.]|nr:Lsr2 family protein [Mycobacterium sp.]
MAKTLVTTDDLDGSPDAETIRFSYNGTSYSIDLGKKNRNAFEKAIKPYIDVAAKTSGRRAGTAGRRSRGTGRRRRSSAVDVSVVRAWARDNGIAVSDRGRVAQSVVDAYRDAHR